MKNKILRCLALAAMVCTMTVAYAQGDYDKYDKDNETYGTTPFINLSDMPRLYDCIPAHQHSKAPNSHTTCCAIYGASSNDRTRND